jgi:vancomycin resistance protein VanW
MRSAWIVSAVAIVIVLSLALWAGVQPARWQAIGAYSTGLAGRTDSQVHNVTLALRSIDGKVLPPGAEFSFNRTVGSWSADRGYVKAPVSYDGELVPDWGGGVCQASTTLYNAALLAGLDILERHKHQFPARYAPPGQDAAVAQLDIDLRFRNPYKWPVRITAKAEGNHVVCRILSQTSLDTDINIDREIRKITMPGRVLRDKDSGGGDDIRWRVVNPGAPGMEVAIYRTMTSRGKSTRTLISEDTYPPMNKLLWAESRRQ